MLNSVFVGRVPLAIAVIAASVLPIWLLDFRPSDASLIEGPVERVAAIEHSAPVEQAVPPAPPEITGPIPIDRKIRIGRGDTLMGLMIEAGVERVEAYNAIEALRVHFDPRRLRPEHEVIVSFEKKNEAAEAETFAGLTLRPDRAVEYAVRRTGDGKFSADKSVREVERTLVRAEGVIRSSLYLSAVEAGVPAGVLQELVRIYSWDVDFQRSIQPDDRFDVMYERFFTKNGTHVRDGEIIYANLVLQGDENPLYRHTLADKSVDYFDDKGKSARKTLMRTPINGARLSSGYGVRRHPILGFNKLHRGVDFAAPAGTPIYAAGDGTIVHRGRNGAYGNYVRIRHNSEYSTAYAHLSRFNRRARNGQRVKQGQIIGYVGSTGRSTGPHLHYEILRRGRQTNPMRVKMPSGKSLTGEELARFRTGRARIEEEFAGLTITRKAVSAE